MVMTVEDGEVLKILRSKEEIGNIIDTSDEPLKHLK